MVTYYLKRARRNTQHTPIQLSLIRLGACIVKDFEQQISKIESGKKHFIFVRTFFDRHSKKPSKRGEEITDSIFRIIRDSYLGKRNIVILNWRSETPLEIKAAYSADEVIYKQGAWEKKLVENFGKGFLITGTTEVIGELLEVRAELVEVTTGKLVAYSKASLPRGPDDIVHAQKTSPAAPLAAVAATPAVKETPPEIKAAPAVPGKEMPLNIQLKPKDEFKDLQYEVIEGENFKYEGYVKNGKKHGQGSLFFNSGDKYVGEWRNDKKHGQGTYTYSDGEKYVGQWQGGNMHGKGAYFFKSGNNFVGHWQKDKKQGRGTYYFKNGDKWEGTYKNDKKHGPGVYTWASGESQEEVYENGKLVQ